MSESSKTRAIIFALVRAHRWALLGYLVALVLAVVGARLGEAHGLWWYLLGTPLVLLAVRECQVQSRSARLGGLSEQGSRLSRVNVVMDVMSAPTSRRSS